jgi:hypothetical protein
MLGSRGSGIVVAACVALAGACLAPPRVASAAQLKQVTERVFPLEAGGEVRVDSQNGRISVEAWNRSEVRIQITREVRSGSDEQAADLMKQLRADVEVGKDHIAIKSVYPKRVQNVGIWDVLGQRVGAVNIHYYLQVPRETELDLRTSNGEVRVRGTTGDVTAATTNGGIDVSGVTGALDVRTTNGEIQLSGIDGSASGGTTNGTVEAELDRLAAGGEVDLSTTNGDVTVALPANLAATLDATTTNGRVRVAFRVTTQGDISSKRIRGTIGGGGIPISLRTTNGNIEISKAKR